MPSDAPTIPGGWLDQDDVVALRVAARAQLNREHARAARMDDVHRAYMLERAARLERALEAFDGIEHGARVEALPSPEEEAAQEAAHLAERGDELRVALRMHATIIEEAELQASGLTVARAEDTLKRTVTDDDLAAIGWTRREVPDA